MKKNTLERKRIKIFVPLFRIIMELRKSTIRLFSTVLFIISSTTVVFSQESMTLEKCINYALTNNLSIQKAGLAIDQSELELLKSKAAFLPSVSANISHSFNYGRSVDFTTYSFSDQIQSTYFNLGSDLTLFNGFSNISNLKASQAGVLSSQESYNKFHDQLIMTVAFDYLQILMNEEQYKYAKQQQALTISLLEKTKLMVEVGQEVKTKELELKATLANDDMTLVESKNKLEQSYLTIKQAMNYDLSKEITISEIKIDSTSFASYQSIEIEKSIDEIISRLPEVKKAEIDNNIAKLNFKAALSLRLPSLTMQSQINTRYSSSAYYYDPVTHLPTEKIPFSDQIDNNFNRGFGFGLNIPVFNNLRNSYQYQVANINFKNSELALAEAKITAKNTVYEAYYSMINAISKYNAAQNSLTAQQNLFEQSNLMYKEGLISYYDWQSAKSNLSKAQTTYLSAKYECVYRTKVFDYYRGIPVSL